MDLSDPIHLGLILVVTGILGVAGGTLKAGILELNLMTMQGKFTLRAMLVVLGGLALIVFDYFFFLSQQASSDTIRAGRPARARRGRMPPAPA